MNTYEYHGLFSPADMNDHNQINFDLKSNIHEITIEDRVSILDEISIQENDQNEPKNLK